MLLETSYLASTRCLAIRSHPVSSMKVDDGVRLGAALVPIDRGSNLKAVEDSLNAVVYAWAGYEYASSRSESLGDNDAAIWTPLSVRDKEDKQDDARIL